MKYKKHEQSSKIGKFVFKLELYERSYKPDTTITLGYLFQLRSQSTALNLKSCDSSRDCPPDHHIINIYLQFSFRRLTITSGSKKLLRGGGRVASIRFVTSFIKF